MVCVVINVVGVVVGHVEHDACDTLDACGVWAAFVPCDVIAIFDVCRDCNTCRAGSAECDCGACSGR